MILNKIKNFIENNALLDQGDKVLVGLSGGADSVCLTHALYSLKEHLGIEIYTAHINHNIRGEEAERDENFSINFSKTLGLKCFVEMFDIPSAAKMKGISEETAGRLARYNYFDSLCEKYGIDKIATAHNMNDNAETLMMNFIRGSTVKGLSGIPIRRGRVIRPVLCLTRTEIEEYCKKNNLDYVTDSTNNENVYTRNKVRHELIPFIESEFNPNFVATVTKNAVLIAEDSEYIAKQAQIAFKKAVNDGAADIETLKTYSDAILRRVIMTMIQSAAGRNEDIRAVYIRDILNLLDKNSGASVNLPFDLTAVVEYGKLIIKKQNQCVAQFEYVLRQGSTEIPELGKTVVTAVSDIRKNDGAVYINANTDDIITVRNRREGDMFRPYGMCGSIKIKKYFINEKIPRDKRGFVPIICINGEIAAVGDRVDRHFLFKDKGLKIEFK